MGGKSAPKRSGGKRRTGHIGFQANEIAFIEDEMAAIAAEYGLEIDQDVAKHVHQRKDAKKARHRKHAPAPPSKYGPTSTSAADSAAAMRKRVVLHALPSRFRHNTPLQDVNEHGEIYDLLRDVLPDGGALSKCGVPGCNCHHGGREMVLDARVKKEHETMARVDALRSGQCKRCHHGVLQHEIVVRDDSDGNSSGKPSGGQRLFSALYQLIRLARIAGTIYTSRVWSKSATELLNGLLLHMRAQFASGGTQNGQKTIAELSHEQQVVSALTTELKKAEQAAGKSTRDAVPIHLACHFDQMYFHCYYAAIVLYGRACGAVPSPDVYFSDLEHFVPDAQVQLEAFVANELCRSDSDVSTTALPPLVTALALPLREHKKPVSEPTLLTIFHARLREGVRLFYDQGVGMHGEMDALLVNPHLIASAQAAVAAKSSSKKVQKKHYRRERSNKAETSDSATTGAAANGLVELPAFPLLAQWRNNCRDWCCHLYAYATPTPAALSVLAKYAPLVEMGAGTGYWSSLLQQQHVDIVAYDKCPPSTDGSGSADSEAGPAGAASGGRARKQQHERNAYHGQVPPFCPIGRGGPEVLTQTDMAARNLFLCYPPPHDDMALLCVRSFQGEFIVHVGEWQGDTGDRRFEKELQRRFVLVQELALPNWGNSAYHLSVWQRKSKGSKSASRLPQVACTALACFTCSKTIEDASDEDDEPLQRCVLCKTNVYCSSECEARGRTSHSAEHAKRLIFLENEDELEFANELHYAPLLNVLELDTESADKVATVQTSWKALTGSGAGNASDDGNDDDDAGSEIDDEDDAAHASDDDDSDMQDSDEDDESGSDMEHLASDQSDDDDDNDDREEESDDEVRAAPAKRARVAAPAKAAPTKAKTAKPVKAVKPAKGARAFAFNFRA